MIKNFLGAGVDTALGALMFGSVVGEGADWLARSTQSILFQSLSAKEIMTDFKVPNNEEIRCTVCGRETPVGDGWKSKDTGGWFGVCNSRFCMEEKGLPIDNDNRLVYDTAGEEEVHLEMEYNQEALPYLRSLPGAEWDAGEKIWRCSADVKDRRRIIEICGKLGVDVPDSFAEYNLPDNLRQKLRQAKNKGAYDFQLKGIKFLGLHDRALLADEMGLGKTVEALLALPDNEAVCVVPPANVKYNWKEEIKRWRPDYSVEVIEGTGIGDMNQQPPPSEGEIVIMNYDILPGKVVEDKFGNISVEGIIPELWEGKTLIFDEIHYARNEDTKRHNRAKEISKHAKKAWGLTGTPMPNNPADLRGVLRTLGIFEDVFKNDYKFKDLFHFRSEESYDYDTPEGEAGARLRRKMLRREREEVLEQLPEKERKDLIIEEVPDSVEETLDELYEEYFLLFQKGMLPPFEAIAQVRRQLAICKTPKVIEAAERFEKYNEPVVIFSSHRYPIHKLGERDGWKTIMGEIGSEKRQERISQFQNGELKGLAITTQAGCEGITLTEASNALFVDLAWNPSSNAQAEDRLCRIGQEADVVNIYRLISDHALDRRVNQILNAKQHVVSESVNSDLENKNLEVQYDEETREEWKKRVEKEEQRKRAEINSKAEEYIHRGGTPRETIDPQSDYADALRAAFRHMQEVCDGALTRDGKGFNKVDAGKVEQIARFDFDEEKPLKALDAILRKYEGQLEDKFDMLF